MPLCIWASTMSGFTTGPQSTAHTTRCTRTAPRDATETSAPSDTGVGRLLVQRVLDGLREHAREDRRRHDAVRPGDRLAARVEAGAAAVVARGPVLRLTDVVFARPDHLHRGADGLGGLERLPDEVQLEAAAEPAA